MIQPIELIKTALLAAIAVLLLLQLMAPPNQTIDTTNCADGIGLFYPCIPVEIME